MCKSALTPHRVYVTSLAWQNRGGALKAFTFSSSEGNLRNEREKAAEQRGRSHHGRRRRHTMLCVDVAPYYLSSRWVGGGRSPGLCKRPPAYRLSSSWTRLLEKERSIGVALPEL